MNKGQEVSLWAALAAGCGSVLAVGVFDLLSVDGWAELLSALIVAAFTGGAVYAQQRLVFAKQRRNGG